MNSNLHSETEFLPTDYATWIAPIRSVGSITGIYSEASLLALTESTRLNRSGAVD